jgi:uncharacterized protein YjdB
MTSLALLTGCGEVVAVHVYPFPLCVPLSVGDSAFATASADRSNFPVQAYSSVTKPEAFSWISSAPENVSVSPLGLIHAKSVGSATISATAEGLTGRSEISVADIRQTASVEPRSVTLNVRDTITLAARAWDSAGAAIALTNGQVLFGTGGDARVIDVWDEWPDRGHVVGVSPGSANITWGVGRRCGVIPVVVE